MSFRILVSLAAAGVLSVSAEPAANPPRVGPFVKIATNATYGCRRPHGFGLYDAAVNQTFVCWNGGGMSVFARAYDHATATWGEARELRHNDWTTTYAYHDYPNMAQAPDGRLVIAYALHSKELHLLRSPQPHSLDGEWTHTMIPFKAAYPMIFRHGDSLYVFNSVSDDLGWPYRSFGYRRSDDNGATWSDHIPAIDSAKQDPDHIDEVYCNHFVIEPGRDGRPDRIHFTWFLHGGPHGHNQGSRDAYFAYFIPSTGRWQAVDGTDLGEVIDYRETLDHCTVRSTGPVLDKLTIGTTISSYRPDGTPFVLYNYLGTSYEDTWTGTAWRSEPLGKFNVDDIQRLPDGSHRLLVVPPGQKWLRLMTQPAAGGAWTTIFESDIPYQDGADKTWSMGFIDDARPEVEVLLSQLKWHDERTNYRGEWPVWILDTRGLE